ncbi:HNH endonuclease [Devosia honganensis]|uniref:HNH endonuclease n=1 Tax=Devosia honganensis TaxID=1610527 RepID=A0ABV7WYF1_9HYPH
MIKLEKRPIPKRLEDNAAAWTKAVVDKKNAGLVPTPTELGRYRHPDIKDVLVEETAGKCAYCESKLQHIHHGDVEHMYPKSLDPTKTFEWGNLTLACEVCNQHKSNKDPLLEHIIDPYQTDPEGHLIFVGGLVFARGTLEGTSTRILLELHRAELVEMRNDQLEKVMAIYAQILDVTLPLPVRRALYQDLLQREASPRAPYTAMTKCLVASMERALDPAILAA